MQLPKKIFPNPLIISTVELRFISDLDRSDALSKFFPIYSGELSKFSNSKIPEELRTNHEQFMFSSDYTLSNDQYSLSFSNKVIVIEANGDYPFWDHYFTFIKNQLSKLFALNVLKKIERIGVRYGSILNHNESLSTILKYNPAFNILGFEEDLILIRSDLKRNGKNLHLQIAKNAKTERNGITKSGTLIDIDASYNNSIDPTEKVYTLIDELHTEEKSLFFELLTIDFLKKLKPEY
jgi:uncharacterized protein (TIGR04255 family)